MHPIAPPQFAGDRRLDHAERGDAVFDQRDIDGELAVARDKLLGAVEGIHQPVAGPAVARRHHLGPRLLRQYGNIRSQPCQRLNDHLMSPLVGRGQRTFVALVLHRERLAVDGHDGRTRRASDRFKFGDIGVVQGVIHNNLVQLTGSTSVTLLTSTAYSRLCWVITERVPPSLEQGLK